VNWQEVERVWGEGTASIRSNEMMSSRHIY
jgi:hypothetical protein